MRTYLILRERARRWNADPEIQALVRENGGEPGIGSGLPAYSRLHRDRLLQTPFDRAALASKGLSYERLDQLTMEVLLGVR